MTILAPLAVQSFRDNNGNPLAGGLLYTYAAGTSTPQTTYQDSAGASPNANPVVLNSRGEAQVWLTVGQAYKFVLQDSLANVIWTVDNINGPVTSVAAGQARLTLSGSNLLLSPMNGNLVAVNGVACPVPDAGVTLAPTGLLATTLYYIYAVATAGVITSLEASTTGHSKDTTAGNKGVEIKTGDSTRSLVGMAYVKTAATFADSITQRFVRSWFNRQRQYGIAPFTANRSVASTSYAEVNSEIRVEFVCWADDGVRATINGAASSDTVAQSVYTTVGWNGVATLFEGYNTFAQPAASTNFPISIAVSAPRSSNLTEGYNYATLAGAVSANNGTWIGSVNTALRTTLSVELG